MSDLGTPDRPLRIAIIGSGPSGFYAAEHLLKQADLTVEVDMFERLPTPFGLVRGGVAPDHDKIKSVTKVYEKTAARPNFRFYGNIALGTDLSMDDVYAHYHAVILAVGAQTDRALGIAGEDLLGSHPATEFVGWYNGHPDYRSCQFNLQVERAVVVGVGNVAMDVARILAKTCAELVNTDIADYALDALDTSTIREIIILGRRGPAQAAFTPAELKEFGELADADVIVSPDDAALDPLSADWLASANDRDAEKNITLLNEYAHRTPAGKNRRVIFRFLTSPVEIIGTERVEGLRIVRNTLSLKPDGSLAAQATDQTEVIPCGLIFRSVGYRGVALDGVPFDAKSGTIPHVAGRVTGLNAVYVVGWIKRGPSGIIGTNKPDSIESADALLADWRAGSLDKHVRSRADLEAMLHQRGKQFVTFGDWQRLDKLEQEAGAKSGRPRLKFTDIETMLKALSHP